LPASSATMSDARAGEEAVDARARVGR